MPIDPKTIETLDLSMFTPGDLLNIVLQRSAVLGSGRNAGAPIKAWEAGDPAPLEAAVVERGDDIARSAATMIAQEFDGIEPELSAIAPARLADIGCGYAMFDLFAFRTLDCDLLLIDIEQNEERHFGFRDTGAAYTSLATARAFLTRNGVPDARIVTWNPNQTDLPEGAPVDLAVSFLSCGFHYPVDGYLPFFTDALAGDGAVILDLRRRQVPRITRQLEALGDLRVLAEEGKLTRVLLRKRAG